MGSKRKIISIFFIEKMIIDELNFLIKELLIALKEIDNLIIDLWHESFLPVNHSVLFISFTFLPFSSWVILVDALKAVIFRHFYHLFPVKMLTIVTILLYLASWTNHSWLPIATIITIIADNHVRMISPGKGIISYGSYVFLHIVLLLMNSLPTSVVLVILEFKLHNFFSRRSSLTQVSPLGIGSVP